jgi:hypothetical protein
MTPDINNRSAIKSAALLEGAHANILELLPFNLYICNMASTIVTVLPVPGGPNTI